MRAKRRRPRGCAPGSGKESHAEFLSHRALADPNQAIRAELTSSRRCEAFGGLYTVDAYAPCLALARLLIHAGFSGDRVLQVWRGPTLCFEVRLDVAARLTVRDGSTGRPVFVPWRERSMRAASDIAQSPPILAEEPPKSENAPARAPHMEAAE